MKQYFIIYNPLAGDGNGKIAANSIKGMLDSVVDMADITKITNYRAFLADKTAYILVICGGMIPTPAQSRTAAEQETSLFVFHGSGKVKTLLIFPKIFSGKHIKYTKYVSVIKGKEIVVEFDNPRPIQIDGETL